MTTKNPNSYETDFYAWAINNAQLLRNKKFLEIDIEHIAEEIEDMGKSEKRELLNRLALLIAHLLKWEFQPHYRGSSWKNTINHQRFRLKKLLDESPSLKNEMSEKLSEAFENALFIAAEETKLPKEDVPSNPLYRLEDLLNEKFFSS